MLFTVVLPARDEESTIRCCIEAFGRCPQVADVLVVANGCTDNTAAIARRAGATVLELDTPGKGYALATGVSRVATDGTVFADADIENPSEYHIQPLVQALSCGRIFVKGYFDRSEHPGPVTDILVKPVLLATNHPASSYSQPLAGIYGGRTSWLRAMHWPNDFGVDLAIALRAAQEGVAFEVEVPPLVHKRRPWEHYRRMAGEISQVLLRTGLIAPFPEVLPSDK